MSVSLEELCAIMPRLGSLKAAAYLPHLCAAMREREIDTPLRAAAFLAQLAHESLELTVMKELPHRRPVKGCSECAAGRVPHAAGAQYDTRTDLGNTPERDGDGVRWAGAGALQLTGASNFRAASLALGVDLVSSPERADDPDVTFRVAAWFWARAGLNALADREDFDTITQRINGGQNGREDRRRYYARAREVLGQPLAVERPAAVEPTVRPFEPLYPPKGLKSA